MSDEFVSKMTKYLAFLYRELEKWAEYDSQDMVNRLAIQIKNTRDICRMFGCEAQVWREAFKIYDRKDFYFAK